MKKDADKELSKIAEHFERFKKEMLMNEKKLP